MQADVSLCNFNTQRQKEPYKTLVPHNYFSLFSNLLPVAVGGWRRERKSRQRSLHPSLNTATTLITRVGNFRLWALSPTPHPCAVHVYKNFSCERS